MYKNEDGNEMRHGKKIIALFIPSLRGGGAERVSLNLLKGFSDSGFEVHLVLVRAEGPFMSAVLPQVKIVDLNAKRVITSIPGLMRYLRKEQPDAMLCTMVHASIAALWAAKLAKTKTRMVVTVHNTLSHSIRHAKLLRARMSPLLVRIFYPWAYRIVVVSEAAKEDLISTCGWNPKMCKLS